MAACRAAQADASAPAGQHSFPLEGQGTCMWARLHNQFKPLPCAAPSHPFSCVGCLRVAINPLSAWSAQTPNRARQAASRPIIAALSNICCCAHVGEALRHGTGKRHGARAISLAFHTSTSNQSGGGGAGAGRPQQAAALESFMQWAQAAGVLVTPEWV